MMARDTQRTIVNNDSRPLTCHHKGRFEQAYIDLAEGLPDGKPVDPNEHAASLWPAGDYYPAVDWHTGYSMGLDLAQQTGTGAPGLTPLSRRSAVPSMFEQERPAMRARVADDDAEQ